MRNYLLRRVFTSLLVLLGVSVFTFLMLHLVPGDPVHALAGKMISSPEKLEEMRHEMGLDKPLPVQYFDYMRKVLHGDFGTSLKNKRPVLESIMEQLPATFRLTVAALTFSTTFGLLFGAIGAFSRRSALDESFSILSIIGISIPPFFLALLLILLFSIRLNWLPSTAKTSDPRSIILPAVTLGIGEAAWLARLVRSSILDELGKNYQWTARAKGAAERSVLWGHVLRNSLIPIITAVGLQFVYLMAGSVLVESIFARQGIGRLALTAIQNRDFPLVQGTVTIISVIYVIVNTVTDILFAVVDPRVRL
ncbi:MAG: ABC transporter permease [Flexilinea sp.]|nr:ABC transporter permease [Flexilinea sp.]